MAPPPAGRALGWTLVAIQVVLFLAVGIAAVAPRVGPELWSSEPIGVAAIVLGMVGFVASVAHLGRALTPHPEPNREGLVAHGIYRWVRHPMYASLAAFAVGVAVTMGSIASYASALALAVLFEVKTRVEERYLVRAYDGYEAYARDTGKFIPGLGRRRPRLAA